MKRKITAALGAVFILAVTTSNSFAQLLNLSDIDKLCRANKSETHRSTIVYVDISSLRLGEDEWGYTILKKLELSTRERLTVLGVNPSNFEVLEVFDLCYPTLGQAEIAKIRSERSLWDKLLTQDPETQQRENLQTFDARLRNSLDKIIAASKKYSVGKRRDVLGAIAVDKNRFTDRETVYRIVIFTNGIISDDLEPGANETRIAELLTKKYPTSFSGAEVSIFGVIGGEKNESLESKERIFSSFFLSNWAHLRSFTPSLPQQTSGSFSSVRTVTGTYEGGGTKGSLKMSFSVSNTKSASVWLTFSAGASSLYVPIDGEYSCSGETCEIKGQVGENIPVLSATPYFRKGDQLVVAGKKGETLSGTLTSETKEVFKPGNANDEVKYRLELVGLN